MKKTLTTVLGAVALVALTALVTTRLTTTAERASPGRRMVWPIPIRSSDSSSAGSGTGFTPRYIITNPGGLSAGSTLVLVCASKDCEGIAGAAGSGAAPGSPKILFEWSIPSDLPANTEMSLSFRPARGAK
jgi:hypothetical protein